MGKIVMIASGKGGTGKTTTAANLGAALAMRDKLTVLVDMDVGLRNLDIALGLESNIVYDLSDVLDGRCSLDEALIKDSRYENLYFLPSPQTRGEADFEYSSTKNLWEQLKSRFEFCIIDSPAGINGGFLYGAICADEAVIVTVPETAAIRDADRAISELEEIGIEEFHLIINRVRPELVDRRVMLNMDECVDILQIPVIGIVPEDDEVIAPANDGFLVVSNPRSSAGGAYRNIALRMCGGETPIMNFGKKHGIFGRRR